VSVKKQFVKMKDEKKMYTNGEVTIVWQADLCIHSKNCWNSANGLPSVFNPRERPWVKPHAATTTDIINQVIKCPSGALTYYLNTEVETKEASITETIVEALENGPLMVYGDIVIKDGSGCETKKNKATAFCRCGGSSKKPYCDGTHNRINFKSSNVL
jgi:uncharacterized Fe-S cluster protein YjdI